MQIALTTARRIFSDASCHPILCSILVHCLDRDQYRAVSQVCRNVRGLLQTDLAIRDRLFELMYNIPPPVPSLDGPLPSRPDDPRTPHDTEAFLREQALQQGPVVGVRDGYMVMLSHKPGADKHHGADEPRATGWTVWALPLWHEVRRTCVTNRDEAKRLRADPIDHHDVPFPPRPSGATKDQGMWTWRFDLGMEIAAVAIQPEENLITVAVTPAIVYYASGDDKNDPEQFRLGRRHRIYFFRLRPPGLGMSYAAEYSKPVRHPAATRPFVDFIEPLNDHAVDDNVKYTLKAGPWGLVALLIKPMGKALSSTPLCVWDWRHGDCGGVAHLIPEVGRFLDFDFLTSKQLVALEINRLSENHISWWSPLPLVPVRSGLTVIQLSRVVPCTKDLVYHSSAQPPSQTIPHFQAHNCWTLDDCHADDVEYVISLDLPPMVDQTMARGPGSGPIPGPRGLSISGTLNIYPPLSDDLQTTRISFSIGCHAKLNGVYAHPNTVLRGAIAAVSLSRLIAFNIVMNSIRTALARWQGYVNARPEMGVIIADEVIKSLAHLTGNRIEETAIIDNEFTGLLEPICRRGSWWIGNGSEVFETMIAVMDATNNLQLTGRSIDAERLSTLASLLGGQRGVTEHAEVFANFLPHLSCSYRDMGNTPFRHWCTYADTEVLPTLTLMSTFADRVLYMDCTPSSGKSNALCKQPPVPGPNSSADGADGTFTLMMRNYSLALVCYPPRFSMDAAHWFWARTRGKGVVGRPDRQVVPDTHAARYMRCSCPLPPGTKELSNTPRGIHALWLGEEVFGSSDFKGGEMEDHVQGGMVRLDARYCGTRREVACARPGIKGVWFDGQTIVLSHGDAATLLCF